jgi:hypothetical protein
VVPAELLDLLASNRDTTGAVIRSITPEHKVRYPIYFRASAAKRHGILTQPTRAIHIELPSAVRMEGDGYARVLAEFLTRAAPLLLRP